MKIIKTIKEIRFELINKTNISFVPTMGNIHKGHIYLIECAKERNNFLVCSIFVNKLQFENNNDFDTYPRTIENDIRLLKNVGVDLLFLPNHSEIYPIKQDFMMRPPKNISSILEGKFRPGFFEGVSTIVLKLFNIVQPNIALFGKKDFQQALIIKKMCSQLEINTNIKIVETKRGTSGLAFSSRNTRLSPEERKEAPFLFKCLGDTSKQIIKLYNDKNLSKLKINNLEKDVLKNLKKRGWNPEYFSVRNINTLEIPKFCSPELRSNLIILTAAWFGKTRLIDNLEVLIIKK